MKIVSYNVNGIRARLHQLEAVIQKHQPDILGLQETKVEDGLFPLEYIHQLGYEAVFHGQKGHYGVAILYKKQNVKLIESGKGFPGDGDEAQCRLVYTSFESAHGPLTVYNGYFPQGESRDHPTKFANKEAFYRNLTDYLHMRHTPDHQVIVLGDMNVAPLDKDIGIGEENRKRWLKTGKCCFLPEERQWLANLCKWGLQDSYENLYPGAGEQRYSWFDYRSRGFEDSPRRGLRIDLILATAPLHDRQRGAGIDHQIRGMDKPSDHCPVWFEFDI